MATVTARLFNEAERKKSPSKITWSGRGKYRLRNVVHHEKFALDHENGNKSGAGPFLWGMFKHLRQPIIGYLHQNPAWLFGAVTLLFSYWLTQASGTGSVATFLRCLGSLCVFGAPFLTLAHLWPGLTPRARWVSLLAVYCVYGVGVVLLRPTVQDLPFTHYVLTPERFSNQWALVCLILTFGVLQTGLWWLGKRKDGPQVFLWLQRLPLLWLAVGLVAMLSLAITLSSNGVQVAGGGLASGAKVGLYLSVFLQCLLVYLPYYLIYHLHHHLLFRELLQRNGLLHYLLGAATLALVFTVVHGTLIAYLPAVNQYDIHPVGITNQIVNDVNLSLSLAVLTLSLPFIIVV
ncbi:MAG: hypothetical protein AAF597_03195, partial [Bacteroidota bacterium]